MDIRFTAAKIIHGWLCIKPTNLPLAAEFAGKADGTYTATIRKQRRSLTANAYAWLLIGKLASALKKSSEEIYREIVQNIGDNFDVLAMRTEAIPEFKRHWEAHGLGWQVVTIGEHDLRGYEEIAAYYGSSIYDTRQMSTLIDLVVQECREQGIETLPPHQIQGMVERWKRE
jgi:hypothetical protein